MKSPKRIISAGLATIILMALFVIPNAKAVQGVRVARTSTTVAKSFDLEVVNLEVTPENPQIGERIDIAARILNKGTQTIPAFTVEAYDQTGWKTFGAGALIQPGQTRVVHMELMTTNLNKQQILYTNPHKFKVVVDPRNLIKELDEENNVGYVEIVVSDPEKEQNILPTEFKVHDSVDYNRQKSVILSWYEAASDVNYNIRYYTRPLWQAEETYGMKFYSMSNEQGFKYSMPEENLSEDYKNTVKDWPEANFNYHVYTAATGYHAAEFFVSDEKINEFAIVAEKNGNQQIGPEIRFYYMTPELRVTNLRPTPSSGLNDEVTLTWTDASKSNDSTWHELKYYSSSDGNPFNMQYYSWSVTSNGLRYYDFNDAANDELKENLYKFQNYYFEESYEDGVYYSRKGHKNSGVFVVITHDNITGRQEISNVIGIDAVDNQWDKDITHAWAAKMIAEDLHYVLQPCEEQPFSDVPINDYYCPAIQKLKNLGVLQGYQDGTFKPYEAYTRVEIAKILFAAYEIQAPEQYAHYFNDVKPETWFFTYVESLQNEIYKKTPWNIGYQDGSYRPADKVYFNWFTQLLNDLE